MYKLHCRFGSLEIGILVTLFKFLQFRSKVSIFTYSYCHQMEMLYRVMKQFLYFLQFQVLFSADLRRFRDLKEDALKPKSKKKAVQAKEVATKDVEIEDPLVDAVDKVKVGCYARMTYIVLLENACFTTLGKCFASSNTSIPFSCSWIVCCATGMSQYTSL